jgi:hypothetical protein
MSSWLDRLANLAIVLACVTVVLLGIARVRSQDTAPRTPARAPAAYARGDRLSPLLGVDFAKPSKTIVIHVRSTCQSCAAGMDFYRALSHEHGRAAGTLQLVVAGTEPLDVLTRFVQEQRLDVDHVVSMRPPDPRIGLMPTLILADRQGIVERTWVGELVPPAHATVIAALRRGKF